MEEVITLNAKMYLRVIAFLDSKIESNRERVKQYRGMAENRTSQLSADKVQSSASMQKMADAVCLYSDIERIIEADVKRRQEIIDTIETLNPDESIVLYKCYVDGTGLKAVARDINRSYSWVSKRHNDGIKSIQKILDDR